MKINANNLHFIVLDCQMPIMDGYETSCLIKKKIEKEEYVNSVVIGYTAEIGAEVEQKCKSAESLILINANLLFIVDGYILKPATEK